VKLWQSIEAVQVTLQKIVKKHPKPGVKADSTAAGTLKMILNVHPKPVKRVVRTVMAVVVKPVTVND